MRRRVRLPVVAVLCLVMVTACTSSKHKGDSTRSTSSDTVSTPGTGQSTSAPARNTNTSTTKSGGSSTTSGSTPPASTAASGGVRACGTATLQIDAVRGSGVSQQQFAMLSFTNKSGSTCSLAGYPGVVLLSGSTVLGNPARPGGAPVPAIALKPRKKVTALLHGPSTCNAPVSTAVRITPPQSTSHVDKPLLMRACALVIDPFKAA